MVIHLGLQKIVASSERTHLTSMVIAAPSVPADVAGATMVSVTVSKLPVNAHRFHKLSTNCRVSSRNVDCQ